MSIAQEITSRFGGLIRIADIEHVVAAIQRTHSFTTQFQSIVTRAREVSLFPRIIERYRKGTAYPLPLPCKSFSGLYRFVEHVYGRALVHFSRNRDLFDLNDVVIGVLLPNSIELRTYTHVPLHSVYQIPFLWFCVVAIQRLIANYGFVKFGTDWKSEQFIGNRPAQMTALYRNSRYLDYVRKYQVLLAGVPQNVIATVGNLSLDTLKHHFLDLYSYVQDPDVFQQEAKFFIRLGETGVAGPRINMLTLSVWHDTYPVLNAYTYGLAQGYQSFIDQYAQVQDTVSLSGLVEAITYEVDKILTRYGLYDRLIQNWLRFKMR